MALTSTKFSNAVSTKVLHDANMTSSTQQNITSGSGYLNSCEINNSNNAAVYVKFVFDYKATVGTTPPDLILSCPASSTYEYEIPNGIYFDALSVFATQNPTPLDNTTPSVSGNEKIAVTIVTT
jgi:hypothetical protein